MIRTLVMIAVAGFLVSVVTLSVAVAIAGPEVIAHGGWSFGPNDWGWGWSWDDHHGGRRAMRYDYGRYDHDGDDRDRDDGGPQTTRTLAWSGGDTLSVDLPADVRYTQAEGPAKLTISGPQDAVADVEVDGGRLRYQHDRDDDDVRLTVVMTAPTVTRFEMQGDGALAIAGYRQDGLDIELDGDAKVAAAGVARSLQLNSSGSGDADLGAMQVKVAQVRIDGSGAAALAPRDSADIDISGSGDVTLLTRPANLQTNISGSGQLRQQDGGVAPAQAPGAGDGQAKAGRARALHGTVADPTH